MSILQVDNLSGLSGTDITIEIGKAIKGAASQFKITGGTAGQVIQTDGSGGLSFTTSGGLPAQTGNTGKYLTTDGAAASWGTVDALPTQTGQAGEFLSTDGSSADWISDAGQIETPGNYYKNYNEITVATTTTVPTTENGIIFGPINSTAEWTINGTLVIL